MMRCRPSLASPNAASWRLIPLLNAPGRVQMAIDRWLFEQHCSGLHPSTLRFYTWEPIALSLGYHQRQVPEAWQHITWQGNRVELVRRPSGGRAVLHQGDLTYAVVTSAMPSRRVEAYQQICEFLIAGWRSLGVSLGYGSPRRGYIHNPNCFCPATGADLVMPDGNKLIGSAQLRQGDAVLQHGSMRLCPDLDLFEQVFGVSGEISGEIPGESVPSRSPFAAIPGLTIPAVIEALTAAACECFDIRLAVQPLSQLEWAAVRAKLEPLPPH